MPETTKQPVKMTDFVFFVSTIIENVENVFDKIDIVIYF